MWSEQTQNFISWAENLTHSSSSAPSPWPPLFPGFSWSALLAIIFSVHDAPAFSSPAKLHFVTVPPSSLVKETRQRKTDRTAHVATLIYTEVYTIFSIVLTNKGPVSFRFKTDFLAWLKLCSVHLCFWDPECKGLTGTMFCCYFNQLVLIHNVTQLVLI